MKTNRSRRNFLKTMVVIPAIPVLSSFSLSGSTGSREGLPHKFQTEFESLLVQSAAPGRESGSF